jgi:hypothetical protein
MSHEYIAGGFYDFESEISMEETQREWYFVSGFNG